MTKNNEVTQVDYNDMDALRAILVGRSIVKTLSRVYDGTYISGTHTIEFTLDNGVILEAREATDGCDCGNGYWSVDAPELAPKQVITNVEVVDDVGDYGATLRMFVYAEGIKTEIVRSEGDDNGYYGWGYHVYVRRSTQ